MALKSLLSIKIPTIFKSLGTLKTLCLYSVKFNKVSVILQAMGRVRIRDSEAEDRAEQSMWADVSSAASDQISLESAQLLPKRPRICSKCKAKTNFFQFCHDCHKVKYMFL